MNHISPKLTSLILCIGILMMMACKPDEEPGPGAAFIEFTINGKEYRIDATNTTVDGTYSAIYSVSSPSHVLSASFSSATNADVGSVSLILNQQEPLEVKTYPNLSIIEGLNFVVVVPDLSGYSMHPQNGIGTVELTTFEATSGGKLEGTFSIEALNQTDENQQVISSGHNLTKGSFRTFLQ